jgi:aconitase A
MSNITGQLTHLARVLRSHLKQLESGETKVLRLVDGGSTDVDDTEIHIAQLRACLQDVTLIAEEVVETQGMSVAIAPLLGALRPEVAAR